MATYERFADEPDLASLPPRPNSDLIDYYEDGHIPAPHQFASSYPPSLNASTERLPVSQSAPLNSYAALPASSSRPELMDSTPYSDIDNSNSNAWPEKAGASSRRSKWIVIGSVAALVVLIAIGVAVGVTVSKHNLSSKNSSNSLSQNSPSGAAPAGVVHSDPNDPSNFAKDSRLHKSFYGLAYTPVGAQLPDCSASLSSVIEDIQLISQLTTRIRLYGADCNQTALVLDAIQRTKVNVTVYVGNYVVLANLTAYQAQRDALESAFKLFGVENVAGVTVGNEVLLNYLLDNGGPNQDINGPVGNAGASQLVPLINDTRTWLNGLNLSKSLLVGNSDAGSYLNKIVLQNIDYAMANVHAWFADQTAQGAAGWVADFFQNTDVAAAQAVSNHPTMFIAETGWPTSSNDTAHASNGAATASVSGLQTFLDNFVCAANKNGTGYFFFEVFDEPWKETQFGGVEGYWGLFTSNKTLKSITIPTC